MDTVESDFSGTPPSVFRGHKEPFSDSRTATKAPKVLPGQPQPSVLSKLRSAFKTSEETEVEDANAAMASKRAAVAAVAERLNGLTTDVDRAKSRVRRAAEELEELRQRRQAYETGALEAWGANPLTATVHSMVPPVENFYARFAAIDAAAAHFPKVKAHLAAKLAQAEKALADFKRAADIAPED